jgi:hypothetical protein
MTTRTVRSARRGSDVWGLESDTGFDHSKPS